MEITLTLQAVGAAPLEVRVQAAPGTPLAAVAESLACAAGRPGVGLYTGSRRLQPDAVLGGPGLRCGDVVGVGGPGLRRRHEGGLLELHVTGGPDAGGVHPLPRGEVVVGRGASVDVRIRDPDLSRRHALVVVSADGVMLRDLGSTNGTQLEGEPVGAEYVPLAVGQRVRAGESAMELAAPSEAPASVRAAGDGTVMVRRPPRLAPPGTKTDFDFPAEPPASDRAGSPVIASLVPLATAGLAAMFFRGGPFVVALGVVSPILFVSLALVQRRSLRRRRARELASYQRALAEAQAALSDALAEEVRLRRVADPDPAAVQGIATGPTYRIWERRPADPDFGRLRLGTADIPARVRRRSAGGGDSPRETARSVPVAVTLPAVGALGLAGPRRPILAVARSALTQLASLHGPADLALVLLAGRSAVDDWSWARWLPHLTDDRGTRPLRAGLTDEQCGALVAELIREVDARRSHRNGSPARTGWAVGFRPVTVAVLDRWSELADLPGLGRLLADGPAVGLFALCLDGAAHLLPAGCAAVAEVTGEVGTRLRVRVSGEPPIEDVVADGVSQAWSEQVARALAPLRDGGGDAASSPPTRCRLLELLELEPPAVEAVLGWWDRGGRTTYAPIGASADGRFGIDLKTDGPHALVAGTTGAGKSELLQTIIASLATANRPDAITFVLIDYKGGAAFADCTHLPHTVGMVTDLDTHLTERALYSLNAELKRREHLLAAAAAKDIDDYWDTLATPATPADRPTDPLPRLILIIDEFATLVEELPDFVTGLIGIAMRGRSLGVHLILATQRPTGVVSPVIRANTNLRIALRVTDDTESTDVIDTRHAAHINKTTPGRGYIRVIGTAPVEFQTARVGGRPMHAVEMAPSVTSAPWRGLGAPTTSRDADESETGPSDLQRLVAAISAAAVARGMGPQRSPWLPPLPPVITVEDLDRCTADAEVHTDHMLVPLGLADFPTEQRQDAFGLDLAEGGSLLIAGGPRSGRSTVLRTLAGNIGRLCRIEDVHVYALDCGSGALHLLAGLPHCGAVVRRDETGRGDRVLTLLLREIRRRQELLARVGLGSVAEQRAADPTDPLPWLVLLVDGWEAFAAGYEAVDHGRPIDTLLTLAREGPAVGLKLAVTSDRQGLLTRLGTAFPEKLILRLTDRLDYGLAGIPPRSVPESMPAGRGLLAAGAVEMQVALLDADPSGPAQAAVFDHIATTAASRASAVPPSRRPFRVRPLPRLVRLVDLEQGACDHPAAEGTRALHRGTADHRFWTVIGAGGDDAAAIRVDLARDGPGFLVAGPARSGRSTALLTLATGLRAVGTPTLLVAACRSPLVPLAHAAGLAVVEPMDSERLAAALESSPTAVLIDDVAALTDTAADEALVRMLRAGGEGHVVVAAGRSDEVAAAFRGTAAEVRRTQAGLLLCPSWTDGDLLGIRLPRTEPEPVPGRGLLVSGGRQMLVQVATADVAGVPALDHPMWG